MPITTSISKDQMHIIAQMYGDYVKETEHPYSFDTWYENIYEKTKLSTITLSKALNINSRDPMGIVFGKVTDIIGNGDFMNNKNIRGIIIPKGVEIKIIIQDKEK